MFLPVVKEVGVCSIWDKLSDNLNRDFRSISLKLKTNTKTMILFFTIILEVPVFTLDLQIILKYKQQKNFFFIPTLQKDIKYI